MINASKQRDTKVKLENRSSFLVRNVRYFWLTVCLSVPAAAWLVYDLSPHERVWHDVVYSLFCLPLFMVFLLALFGSILSFLLHHTLRKS